MISSHEPEIFMERTGNLQKKKTRTWNFMHFVNAADLERKVIVGPTWRNNFVLSWKYKKKKNDVLQKIMT
jgi:hypothetical protein